MELELVEPSLFWPSPGAAGRFADAIERLGEYSREGQRARTACGLG
jgi:hypothetical protein